MSDNNNTPGEIAELLRRKKMRVHLLGICGVGMAGLAFILKKRGFEVTGCDQSPNHLAKWLTSHGITVFSGHDPAHVAGADMIIRSNAVPAKHPELQAARKAGKKIFQRGLVLAAISSGMDSICVSGTHGKTTTTAMIVQMLIKTGLKPSFCIGGEVPALGGVAGRGRGKNIVLEADESDGTLAYYKPFISVITNIEFDHAEYFKNLAAVKNCFAQMAKGARHKIVYCSDDKEAGKLIGKSQNAVSYGFFAGANLRLTKWKDTPDGLVCSLASDGKRLGQIRLPVPGKHNALNAAAACAVGLELGISFAVIARALAGFQPVARRFERIVETKDLLVVSDYAHHPAEIAALLAGARALKRNRWLAVFQPHRYSRTKALGKLFPPAFRGVNELVLCPVYAASETKIAGGTFWDLYEQFRKFGKIHVACARSLRQAWDYLKTVAAPGDGILIIGAGDVEKIAAWARKELVYSKMGGISCQRGATLSVSLGGANPQDEPFLKTARRAASPYLLNFFNSKLTNSAVRFNESLAGKTTLRVGGFADIYIEAGSLTDLALIAGWAAKNRVPLKMIGAGSNVLVSDLGVRGIVVRLKGAAWQDIKLESKNETAVGAGVSLQKLVAWTALHGMAGAEFLTGIPGTVGGAVRMNAGAFGKEMGGIVSRVKVMEQDGTIRILNQTQLGFSYRCCAGLENRIVLEAVLTLKAGKPDIIRQQMSQTRKQRNWLSGLRSAGSVFKNPAGDSAGRLLERLGLKGRRIGGAKISEQHANIITTEKGASASDALALIEIAHYLAQMKYGVDLEREVAYFE